MSKKVLVIFGTRPKMAPLIKELKSSGSNFEVRICVTAQHREMLDQVMSFFNCRLWFRFDETGKLKELKNHY